MPGVMSVNQLHSADFTGQRAATSSGQSSIRLTQRYCAFAKLNSSCFRASSSSLSGRRPMRLACHFQSSLVAERGALAKSANGICGTPGFRFWRHNFDFGYIIPLTQRMGSVSARKKFSRRPHCQPVARISDVSNASPMTAEKTIPSNFRETAQDQATTGSREIISTSTSSSSARSGASLPVNLAAGVSITAAVIVMAVLGFMAKPRTGGGGSVSDLISRGQLRSGRGEAGSKNLLYQDPFDNPLVKMGSKNPVVRMCGKLFRLAPVTLTEEKVANHQQRRTQAYKWKRPVVFLTEGDPVPEGVDSEEVRWIPSNHPFATTSNYIDEELAQKNVYQTRGVPSRVRAEHEALRKKILETAKGEPDFRLPSTENSGAQAWKTSDNTPEAFGGLSSNEGQSPDQPVSSGSQVIENAGGTKPLRRVDEDDNRSSGSEPRYRTIDMSTD